MKTIYVATVTAQINSAMFMFNEIREFRFETTHEREEFCKLVRAAGHKVVKSRDWLSNATQAMESLNATISSLQKAVG